MSFSKFQKTIALTSGVLVLSGAIVFIALAVWQGPTADPPDENVAAPINVGSDDQTKTGDLTVGNLFLDNGAGEGNIENANQIIGYNDLHLWSGSSQKSTMYLDNAAANNEGIKFYTQGEERMIVGADGNIYMPGLTDCFLMVDDNGKVLCYSGEGPPGAEQEFQSILTEIEHLSITMPLGSGSSLSDEYTYTVIDPEVVIKFYGYAWSSSYNMHAFYFLKYENLGLTPIWEMVNDTNETKSEIRYYHAKQGDKIKIGVGIEKGGAGSHNRQGKAKAYLDILSSRRKDNITKITSTGDILYCYDVNYSGEMGKASLEHVSTVPSSIVATADGIPIKIVVEE
jgi:hypothetical protein